MEETEADGHSGYEVVTIESQSDLDRKKNLTLTLSQTKIPPENITTPQEGPDEESGRMNIMNHPWYSFMLKIEFHTRVLSQPQNTGF